MMQMIRSTRPLVLLAATMLMAVSSAWAQSPAPAPAPFDAVAESRKVIDALGAGRFAEVEARYSPEMLQALPVGQLAVAWAQVNQQLGALKRMGEPKVEVRDGITVVTFPAVYDVAPINLLVMWNAAGKMAGLLAQPGGTTT